MARNLKHFVEEGSTVIDSRDVIERIEALRLNDANLDDDEREELERLVRLDAYGRAYFSDWEYGTILVIDSYFVEYAKELAYDIGAVNTHASWPNNHIDWSSAAEDLKQDYTAVEYGDTTYWGR